MPYLVMITGHRPQYMSPSEQTSTRKLLHTVLARIQTRRPEMQLLSGMAIGADQWATEAALQLGVPVQAAVPFKGQESRWSPPQQAHYHYLLSLCSQVHILSDAPYHPSLYLMRNQWLVEHANLALAVWGGARSGGTWDAVQRVANRHLDCLIIWREKVSCLRIDP